MNGLETWMVQYDPGRRYVKREIWESLCESEIYRGPLQFAFLPVGRNVLNMSTFAKYWCLLGPSVSWDVVQCQWIVRYECCSNAWQSHLPR